MSEQIGLCRKQCEEWYAHNLSCVPGYAWTVADAIDRLAADVASIRAKVDDVSPDDVKHFVESEKAWVALVTEQRDAAIRERDEARAEVERLKAEMEQQSPAAPQPAAVGDAQAAMDRDRAFVQRHCAAQQAADAPSVAPQPAAPPAGWLTEEERDVVNGIASMIEQWFKMAWSDIDEKRCAVLRSIASRAAPQPAGHGISPGLPETQLAGNAVPPAGWLTDEERRVLQDHARSLREQRRSMERAQTLGSSANPATIKREADLIDDILARAGSPPVVEVPPVFQRSSLGDKLVAMQQVKDAMDAAGVSWREVPRD